jgi:hypothetical protein
MAGENRPQSSLPRHEWIGARFRDLIPPIGEVPTVC